MLVALVLAISWSAKGYHAARSARMSPAERLSEDLRRLERVLLRVHPAPFRNASEGEIRGALARAAAAIERLERGELDEEGVLAHFLEAVASLRDPHTAFRDRYATFGILRVGFRIFGEEVRIVAADDPAVRGARVTAFEGTPAAEVLERARRFVPCPNESCFLVFAPGILRTPGLLHQMGVSADPSRLRLEVVRADGSAAEIELPRVTPEEFREARPEEIVLDEDRLPLYRRGDRGPYWFEALPDRGALYFRFALAADSEEPLAEVARRALAERAALDPGPVIVDLRGNPGGNPQAHIPLVAALAAADGARGPAALRVLVDRDVFSAAVVAAGDLERRAGALLVGEEPGDLGHLTTDARPFTLRHSGAEIWVPIKLMRTAGGAGERARLVPARRSAPTFEDWLAGRDPALEAALAPLPEPALEPGVAHEARAGSGTGGVADGAAAAAADPAAAASPARLPPGRFAFDAQRALVVAAEAGGLRATVTGLGSDRLAPSAEGVWAGGIQLGLRAGGEGGLERLLPDGSWVALPRLAGKTALELALAGRLEEASAAYGELTSGGRDRLLLALLGLVAEGTYRYAEGESEQGHVLFDLARQLSPADALIPLQHSLLRRKAEGRWVPPVGEVFRAAAACVRHYREAELLNDLRMCL